MKSKILIPSIIILLLLIIVFFLNTPNEKIIKDKAYDVLLVEYGKKGEPYHTISITDKQFISKLVKQINNSKRTNLETIDIEPFTEKDGFITFKNEKESIKLGLYYGTGNLLSNQYLIETDIDFMNLKNK